jgi:type VI protein secretion system component VasF
MKRLIERIRQKPQHHQNRIIWIIAGAMVIMLVVAWAFIGLPNKGSKNSETITEFGQILEENKLNTSPIFEK